MHRAGACGEDLTGRNGYFAVQGEERGIWADLPWLPFQLKAGVPINNS